MRSKHFVSSIAHGVATRGCAIVRVTEWPHIVLGLWRAMGCEARKEVLEVSVVK